MEKFELSPAEVITTLNWKKSKVYYWINSGKFETVERIDGQKVVLTQNDIDRLKVSNSFEDFENPNFSEKSLNYSEKFQESAESNITKNYEKTSNNSNSNNFEIFNNTLELVKQIHQSSLMNYNHTVKLLTDGQNSLEAEHLELKAEYKSVQEKLKKSENEFQEKLKKFENKNNIKNNIIIAMATVLFLLVILFFLSLNNFVKFENFQKNTTEQIETNNVAEAVVETVEQPVKPVVKRFQNENKQFQTF